KWIATKKANKKEFDEEAVRFTLEEKARYEKLDQDRSMEEEEFEYNQQWYNHILTPQKSVVDRGEPGWRLNEDAPGWRLNTSPFGFVTQVDRSMEEEEFEYNQQWYNHILTPQKSVVEGGTAYVQTQESVVDRGEPGWRLNEDALGATVEPIVSAEPSVAANETTPKGKTIESNAAEPPNLKKQGRKRKVAEPSAAEPPFRIYHKNRGRSERIFNQKMKKTGFCPNGEGSTADKAFSL
ncbi:hypothetical protein Tco_1364542, partial [Tanacetum coccineum]